MSLAEEVKRVLLEHPEILAEALLAHPEVVYQALAKLAPWERLATKEDIERLRSEMATKEDLERLRSEVATKEDLEKVRAVMATKEELRSLEERLGKVEKRLDEIDAQLRFLAIRVEALGARWGVVSEEAFREGVRELLKEAGFVVEKWLYYDGDGFVYGYPSEVELDVVVRDGVTMAVEIASSLKRADLHAVRRKAELYEKATGRKVDRVVVITPYISDRNPPYVKAMAERLGVKIVTPEEAAQKPA
ncbi:MAG: PD-(D/E)XK nuclease family protein [Pyrobaculum sp.]|uniref:PD-(D/E)XK nuclease family protein n=1 Tax=Pyrobaculum sp. TaxID=2004705 RepID=UPI0031774AB5